jgi:copper transport protein
MRRPVGALLVAASIILIVPAVAIAHAGFVSSEPEPGAELGSAPGVVVLEFSEQVNEQLSRAQVVAPDGTSFEGSTSGPRSIEIPLTTNLQGIYDVVWTTVSRVDGHTLHGSFQFGVGVRPTSGTEDIVADEPGLPELAVGVARAVEDLALLLAVGGLLLGAQGRRQPTISWVRPPIVPFLVTATLAGSVVVIGETLLAAPSPSWGSIAAYLTSGPAGVFRLLRPLAEVGALVAAVVSIRLATALVAIALGLLAAAGHAAVVSPPALGIGIQTLHLWSAACWAGGILALSLLHPPGGWLQGDGRALLERFTPVALITFGVTAVTGALRGVQEVGGLGSLFTTLYGWTLIAKVLAVGLMVELSFLAWRRIAVWPRLEASFAVAALGAAALLASFPLPPARSELAEKEAASGEGMAGLPSGTSLTLGGHAGPVLVGLSVDPGEPGTNVITLFLLPVEGEAAAAPIETTLDIDGEQLALTQCGATCRESVADLDGGERVRVRIPGEKGGAAIFALPDLPAPNGTDLVERMMTRMHALHTYRLDETLSSGGPNVVSEYTFRAPDRGEARTETSDGTTHVVWIGTTQYLRTPGNEWSVSEGGPGQEVPSFIWDYFQPFRDVREVGSERVEGAMTSVVSFFGGAGTTPVWFKLWIDGDGIVRRAEMRAQGHFMDHRYFAFNEPVTIEPPKEAGG